MRTSTLARNASGLALLAFFTGCSGGGSQTPGLSGLATSLGQKSASSTSHGFMNVPAGPATLIYMSSWGSASVVDVMTMNGEFVGQITNGLAVPEGLFTDASGNLWVANMNNVLVFPHGGLTATATLTDPVGNPIDVTVCPNGTAYVANF
jgi:hypothetical protein